MKKIAILFLSTFLIPLALQPASFASADNRDEGVVAFVHPDYNPHDEGTLR